MSYGLCSRRHLLCSGGYGVATLGLVDLLRREGLAVEAVESTPEANVIKPDLDQSFDLRPKPTHHPAKATAMISLEMIGGPSQIDLFDYKPELVRLSGQKFPGEVQYDNPAQASPLVQGPMWGFRRYGECGLEMSELLPCLGEIADDITLIRSMHTGVNNHLPSIYALNSGAIQPGRPSLGSWLLYGLGSGTDELPAYVALTHPSGGPLINSENWTNGWMPSIYQGTVVRPKEPRILNLDPPDHLVGQPQAAQLELLRQLNARHLADRPGESDLQARIANFELAARMQLSAKEVFDISGETQSTLEMYGIHEDETRDYGTRCLIARRLVERGVRFVQVFAAGQTWDHHQEIFPTLPRMCREIDRPAAALVADLKQRGLLDSTIVRWGGEMGRLPTIQVPPGANAADRDKLGRDHNTYGFSMWVAGGGLKRGHAWGVTDEFSHHAVENKVTHADWLVTVQHLFGLNPAKLAFKRNARELTLTDGAGKVVDGILA